MSLKHALASSNENDAHLDRLERVGTRSVVCSRWYGRDRYIARLWGTDDWRPLDNRSIQHLLSDQIKMHAVPDDDATCVIDLPDALLQRIVGYLLQWNDVRSLCLTACICTAFQRAAHACLAVSTSLQPPSANCKAALVSLLPKLHNLISLDLSSNFRIVDDDVLTGVAGVTALRTLMLSSCSRITSLGLTVSAKWHRKGTSRHEARAWCNMLVPYIVVLEGLQRAYGRRHLIDHFNVCNRCSITTRSSSRNARGSG
jgi:hypothetical protein